MKTKNAILILVIATCLLTQAAVSETLKLYLPRQVDITDDTMLLGDIAIMRGNPEDTAKASAVTLGKFSVPGQQITVNRTTILSRLTANNINSKNVTFSGAEDISVGRKEIIISINDITAKADKFLKENNPNAAIASYELTRGPKRFILPAQKAKITLVPRLGSRVSTTQMSVDVDVMLDGKKIGTNQVTYRPMYDCRQVVAKTDVPAGSSLNSDNIKIETVTSRYPEQKGWKSPVGLIAKRNIKSGQLIRNSLLAKAKPQILIKRNSLVVIKIQTLALTLTVSGKAMGEGAFGDMIRVKNIDSKKIIICKVNFDGTVSPVL